MSDFADTRTDLTGLGATIGTALAAKVGSTVSVTINGTTLTVQIARDLVVAAGDVVMVQKVGGQWFVLQRLFTGPPVAPPNLGTPATGGPTSGTLVVAPVETRTYQSGAWRSWDTSVFQGQYGGTGNRTGAAFYGGAPRSLAGAIVTYATVRVRRMSGGNYGPQATTMRLVTQATRPGGAPTLTSSSAGPNIAPGVTVDSFPVPIAWVQAMVDGTAGGLGFFVSGGSPYVQFAGNGDWAPAFTLNVNWSRG